jgi:hypothetical protein
LPARDDDEEGIYMSDHEREWESEGDLAKSQKRDGTVGAGVARAARD